MPVHWHTRLYASALLVLSEKTRLEIARQAVACFLCQTWEPKELIVVNGTGQPFDAESGITVIEARGTVDGLNRLAWASANGEWCVWWSDACFYGTDYLRLHVQDAEPGTVTAAIPVTGYCVDTGTTRVLHGWDTAMLSSGRHFFAAPSEAPAGRVRIVRIGPDNLMRFIHGN